MASTITDSEFGAIRVKRVHGARRIKLHISPGGILVATLPKYVPLYLVKNLINNSRQQLWQLISTSTSKQREPYRQGEKIGASHMLRIERLATSEGRSIIKNQIINVRVPADAGPESEQDIIRQGVTKALKKEAAAYLPRRLSYLAESYGFSYESVRYSNAKGRWGSCSNSGTISLNIALMNLPPEVIDYVLIHELCHTAEMNHSKQFWQSVEKLCPNFRDLKKTLGQYSPYL